MNKPDDIQAAPDSARTAELQTIAAARIAPSPLNPRTHWDPAKIEEMRDNFQARGFDPGISRLLVRPLPWLAVDSGGGWDITVHGAFIGKWWKALPSRGPLPKDFVHPFETEEAAKEAIIKLPTHECVLGHRRHRAAFDLGLECPCAVADLTEAEVIELQLIENLQRDDLSPLDEAEGLGHMLALKDAEDQPVHTPESIARAIGKKPRYVQRRLLLRGLRGSPTGAAIESGKLSARHGWLIMSLPTVKLQSEVAGLALKDRHGIGEPMTTRELEDLIAEKYTRALKEAGFDQEDAQLVPEVTEDGQRRRGGKCSTCPFNTKNTEEEAPADGKKGARKFHMCLNLECYSAKQAAAYEVWAAGERKEGVEVLSIKEAAQYLNQYNGGLTYGSGLVELDEKPDEHLLKEGTKNPPTWKKLIAGQGATVLVFRRKDGHVFRTVKRALAIEAAKKNGHKIFDGDEIEDDVAAVETEKRRETFIAALRKDPANATLSADEAKAEFDRQERERVKQKAEADRQKAAAERQAEQRCDAALGKAILTSAKSAKKMTREFWDLILGPLLTAAYDTSDAQEVASALGISVTLDAEQGGDISDAVAEHIYETPEQHLGAVVLVLAGMLNPCHGDDREQWRKQACKALGVDAKAVRKTTLAELATEQQAAAEEREIASGLKWVTRREKAEQFEWNGAFAVNPDLCQVALPSEVKADMALFAARGKKGWRAGVKITSKKHGDFEVLMQDSATDYGTRELAIIPQLKAAEDYFTKAKVPTTVARLEAYLTRLQTPSLEKPAKAVKTAKRKGK